MFNSTRVTIPTLVRIKPGALGRLGVYLGRAQHEAVALFQSDGLAHEISGIVRESLHEAHISAVRWIDISDNRFECAITLFRELPAPVRAIVGLGGGKALDVAKYVAFLARGRLLLSATMDELRQRLVRYRLRYEGEPPDAARLGTVLARNGSGRQWQAVIQDPVADAVAALRQSAEVAEFEEAPLTLEEAYAALTARED